MGRPARARGAGVAVMLLAPVATFAAVALTLRPRPHARRRLRMLVHLPGAAARPVGSRDGRREVGTPTVLAGCAGASVLLVLAGAWPVAMLLVLVVGARRRRPRTGRPAPDDLALLAELLAGCLRAGAAPVSALLAAASVVASPLDARLRAVGEALRSGAPPAQAWAPWMSDTALASIARPCLRASATGATAAAELTRVGARLRARHRADVAARLARTSVWVVLPMGLCFLPAFVLVGVVPLVVGLVPALR